MSTNAPGHETEMEDRPFRELLARNPRPALLWLAGLLVLLALEAGRVFAGFGRIFGIVGFLFGMLSAIPGYVGGNFESAIPDNLEIQLITTDIGIAEVVGLFATSVTAVLLIFLLLLPFGELVPDRVFDRAGLELTRRQRRWSKRGVLTAFVSVVAGLVLFSFAGVPDLVGDTVESVIPDNLVFMLFATEVSIPGLAGLAAASVTAVLMIFLLLLPFGELVPDGLFDRTRLDLSPRERTWAKRGVLAAAVSAVLVPAVVLRLQVFGVRVFTIGSVVGAVDSLASTLPSITSRELISNEGHRTPPDGEGWEGPPLGLTPAQAWGLRVALVITYATVLVAWFWRGYNVYRTHYRQADWTPTDDTLRRFRGNYWGLLGLAIVFLFVVMALWAPAVSPVTAEENIMTPSQHEIQFFNEETGEVETELQVFANLDDETDSDGQNTVGPWSYDKYDRWQPLGTTDRGQNMMTHLAYGARTSLIIGVSAIGLSALIAVVLSLVAAYYKGVVDLVTVVASDTIQVIPLLLLVMMLSVIFQDADHAIAQPLDGGFLLAMIFAVAFWPAMWRTVRGPALQVSEQEWVDAAKSYGQQPLAIMRKHMAPYIAGYIMIYASLLLGSIIISVSALTFLGLGIDAPTPEWGRLINDGQSYVATSSWHVATVPGLAIVFVVVAFNALGDAIRDAIDPESGVDEGTAAAGGGA